MNATGRLLQSLVRHNVGLWRLVRGLELQAQRRHSEHVADLIEQGPEDLPALRQVTAEWWPGEGQRIESGRQEVAEYESEFLRRAVDDAVPAASGLPIVGVAARLLRGVVAKGLSNGRTPEQAVANLAQHESRLTRQAVAEIATAPDASRAWPRTLFRKLRRVRGWLAGEWGTFAHGAAAAAREQVAEANSDLFESVIWLSIIDANTTVHICLPRHMKRYTIDTHQPIGHRYAWLSGPGRSHHKCRSVESYGFRDAIDLGLGDDTGMQIAFDGEYPEDMGAEELLRQQSDEELRALFGPRRAALFRSGGVTLDELIARDGRTLRSLDQLRAEDAAAFERAGIN